MNTPDWAARQEQERAAVKAARLAALWLLRGEGLLPEAPKTEVAAALGVSRWTLDRDLATLPDVADHYGRYRAALVALGEQA